MPRSALLIGSKRVLLGLASAGALLAAPGAAEAKTFFASFSDPDTDGKGSAARDIVAGRVAYNRRTGVLSSTVEVQADWAEDRDADMVVVIISDLVQGTCKRETMVVLGSSADPGVPQGFRAKDRDGKHPYYGRGEIDGTVFKMRVKAKGLAGNTPGCVTVGIVDDVGKVLDETPIDNGFR
ncbi:MAG: hypothetical protein PGN13_14015 [Patulibacter minatonensis]